LHGVFDGFEVVKSHAADEDRDEPTVLVPEVMLHETRR